MWCMHMIVAILRPVRFFSGDVSARYNIEVEWFCVATMTWGSMCMKTLARSLADYTYQAYSSLVTTM